jgi:hypothetical protein
MGNDPFMITSIAHGPPFANCQVAYEERILRDQVLLPMFRMKDSTGRSTAKATQRRELLAERFS